MQDYVEKSKHSFLPLTRLDHNQLDPEFENAFDAERVLSSVTVSYLLAFITCILLPNGNLMESKMYRKGRINSLTLCTIYGKGSHPLC